MLSIHALRVFQLLGVDPVFHSCSPQIVDSIMALFRVDFSGRGELADRQQKLAQMLSRLQKISEGTWLYSKCSSYSQQCRGSEFWGLFPYIYVYVAEKDLIVMFAWFWVID